MKPSQKHVLALPMDSGTESRAAYIDLGDGPPVILLHGFLGDGTCWLPLMAQLQVQARCLALDLLGFGDSAKPMIRYDVAQEVSFVRRFIEALNLDACYLVGHSFGGWVASAYALAYPETVRGLVLVAPAGIRDDSFCGRYDHLRFLLWKTPIVDWGLRLATPLSTLLGQRATVAQLTEFRQKLMTEPAARSFLVDRLRPEDAIDTVEKDIHRLRVPTLVIAGAQDETIPLWHCQTYAHEISNARLAVLDNADHALPQNFAADLATLIAPFLATH